MRSVATLIAGFFCLFTTTNAALTCSPDPIPPNHEIPCYCEDNQTCHITTTSTEYMLEYLNDLVQTERSGITNIQIWLTNATTPPQPGFLAAFTELQQLYLWGGFPDLLMGTFVGLDKLLLLDLSGNALTTLDPLMFTGLPGLTHLDLSFNNLKMINESVFQEIPTLTYVNFWHNKLQHLDAITFQGLSNLNQIDFSDNHLESLDPSLFEGLPKLEDLDFTDNNLRSLDPMMFQGMPNLQFLYLENNALSSIEPGTFMNNTKLQDLDLTNNRLSSLPRNLCGDAKPKNVLLTENPWKCNEDLLSALEEIGEGSIKETGVCALPSKMRGVSLLAWKHIKALQAEEKAYE